MVSELAITRRELLAEAATLLRDAGVTDPRREAARIWSGLERTPLSVYPLDPDAIIAPARTAAFLAAVRRRATGEPLAHVTGWAGFRHLTLRSDARALIPRPETEGLVDLVLARVRTGTVADIGTGTGCIALSLAVEGGFTQVVGIDLSPQALALAAENRRDIGARVALIRGDLTECLPARSLDALVSNPPYLTTGEYGALDASVRDWEPKLALAAGPDGLDAIGRLLADGRRVLRSGAWLALEVDEARAGQCAARAGASGYTDVAVHTDLFGRERYLLARRSDAE
ncbi:MAG TPA: peptide chain release factor N(5)-glutamine methyltransferase [Gemmatimonadales bacterium]|nr:peptide chain release factor N(5)-glutamine methyltransferase [Gemmatimonadales bacterium]